MTNFLSRHSAHTLPGKLRSDIPLKFVHCLLSHFLNIGIITPVCQSQEVLPNFHATSHTRINQRIHSSVSAFNISGLISSSPAAFPDYIPSIAVSTSAAVNTSSSLNVSFPMCHKSMPLLDSKDLPRILSITKGFHSNPLECCLQNS